MEHFEKAALRAARNKGDNVWDTHKGVGWFLFILFLAILGFLQVYK